MTSDHHARVKEIFLAVCEQPPARIEGLLDELCAGDDSLRREVRALLAYDDQGTTEAPSSRHGGGSIVGQFRLVRRLGAGGMGDVWLAVQEGELAREVAVKLIKWGMDSDQVVARFDLERQALARMNHPNIARVLEAGTAENGRPYFAMELVRGIPITAFFDDRRLSAEERLDLMASVCEGVHHARQRGIIHRDLKPSNILVEEHDGRPVPKIIDFGIAKAVDQRLTERTVYTELGQWIGTPAYMSPEQTELTGADIDTRTDVYSLGAVLYELLVGAQPFDPQELRSAGFEGMRRLIRDVEPPRPSTRISTLGGESKDAASNRRTDPSGPEGLREGTRQLLERLGGPSRTGVEPAPPRLVRTDGGIDRRRPGPRRAGPGDHGAEPGLVPPILGIPHVGAGVHSHQATAVFRGGGPVRQGGGAPREEPRNTASESLLHPAALRIPETPPGRSRRCTEHARAGASDR